MRATVDQLAQRLGSALGSTGVSIDSASRAAHRIDRVTPALLVSPESTEQIAAVLRLCSEVGATMIPWGGGTAMAIGNPPRRADVVVKLNKLARVIEHDAANLTASVECGVTLTALQSAVAAQKQFAPINAPFPDRATIGGIVAGNLNGPRRSCYGGTRDLVIGIKVVVPSGEVIKAGGKVVKNVAGYDMSKLFVGSLGTLGIVTEATLRVAPIAESAATLVADGALAQAATMIREISRSALLPMAAFLRSDNSKASWRVAVWCEGFAASIERQLRELEAMTLSLGMRSQVLQAQAHVELWDKLRDFPLSPNRVMYRVALPRAAVFAFLENSKERHPGEIVCDALMGTVWLSWPPREAAIQRFSALESLARQERGHAVLFAAPAALKAAVNVWGTSPATLSIMREIKHQFDPQELLNPGRFLGGI
jgi:glycolate oxidase FAD binding subunit